MQRLKLGVVLLLLLLVGGAQPGQVPAEPAAETVYVTKTGAKYHRGSCRSLSKSKIPISLEDARKSYSPCSVCNPPAREKL